MPAIKTPTLTLSKRNVRSNNLFEAHLNKSAIELINAEKIIFVYDGGGATGLKLPEKDSPLGYKISMHTQKYKKKKYTNSSAKFSPVIEGAGGEIVGKYSITKSGQNFLLTKIDKK